MTADGGTAEGEALVGGMVNAGAIFRRGALVERPAPRTAPALHAHLRALAGRGFDGAPCPVRLLDPASAAVHYPAGLDTPARLRILADGYGLSRQERAELPATIEQVTAACRAFVAGRVADGDPAYTRALSERGGWQRWDRAQEWLAARRETFTTSLLQ